MGGNRNHRRRQLPGCTLPAGCVLLAIALTACQPDAPVDLSHGDSRPPPGVEFECARQDPGVDSEARLKALDLLAHHGPVIPTDHQLDGIRTFLTGGDHLGWCHDRFRSDDIRRTGPLVPIQSRTSTDIADTSLSTHARVRVYYSEQVVGWLRGGRDGAIPDGAMIVKEMYPGVPGRRESEVDGWAVMVRDSQGSADGWLWYLYYKRGNVPYTLEFESGQYGLSFCVACHASADREGTFAYLGNLTNTDVATFVELPGRQSATRDGAPDGAHGGFAAPFMQGLDAVPEEAPGSVETDAFELLLYRPLHVPRFALNEFPSLFDVPDIEELASKKPVWLPMDAAYDHLPPAAGDEQRLFVTASTCSGCHEAADLLNGTNPEMTVPVGHHKFDKLQQLPIKDPTIAALTPYGEWSASPMALSARDPVFRAQLEWELARYPARAGATESFCLSCHAPMGERTDPDLPDKLAATYEIPDPADPERNARPAAFAALARDGVSCTVCHHMADQHLGEKESFNARFVTGPADELYGPYEDVKTVPMREGLGIEPVHGAHMADSGICGTCHMVETPVADNPDIESAHEQTTYLEWRNSAFADTDDPGARTCQGCHMPDTNPLADDPTTPTEARIANIEDSAFPYTANRRSSEDLDTEVRRGYRRHTLVGINLFTLSFFQQFPRPLGSNTFYPVRAFSATVSPKALAMVEMTRLAREQTATVEIANVERRDGALRVTARITNITGHKFPSGVGFRRAFVTAELTDQAGERVWCSGCSNDLGVIVGGAGEPLTSEFSRDPEDLQPYRTVIDAEDQVQIYETRHINAAGALTTSFLELDEEVKDTRLLPRGWNPDGFPEYHMNPVGKPIPEPAHVETFVYQVPAALAERAAQITLSLNYQALPPYYLVDRMELLGEDGEHPETQRLLYMLSHLELERDSAARAIRGWKLTIGRDAADL